MSLPSVPEALTSAVIPSPIAAVIHGLREKGHQAFLVGGCVRDLLRGQTPKDFDVATSARPEEVQRAFAKVIPTGIAHGTVTVMSRGNAVEVTTFRSEGAYVDGRRPTSVTFETDIREDLSRRDFTINAMAFDPDSKTFVDPFEGQKDLAAKTIRCVGTAMERFSEDGLRPFRAVRFAAVLGFTLESTTREAIPQVLDVAAKVARERVREELQKLLLSSRPARGLDLLRDTQLLSLITPTLAPGALDPDVWSRTLNAVEALPPKLGSRLVAWLHRSSEAVAALERLKPPNALLSEVTTMLRELPAAPSLHTDRDLRTLASRTSPTLAADVLELHVAVTEAFEDGNSLEAAERRRARLTELLAENPPLTTRALALTGKDIMGVLALPPSPRVGEATRYLLEAVLESPVRNTPDALTQLLREWQTRTGS